VRTTPAAGKKAEETSCSARPCPGPQAQKSALALDLVAAGWTVGAVAEAVGIASPHLSVMRHRPAPRPRGRPPLPDTELVADLPTYGYRHVHALLRRQAEKTGRSAQSKTRLPRHESARARRTTRRRTPRGAASRCPCRRRPPQHSPVL
jgi:hypothetical protein